MGLESGTVISNRYVIMDEIGTGGMSNVYKAMDRTLNRYVAVKVLKQEFVSDESFAAKFRTEAQAAAALTHPNIVNVYDVGVQQDVHYIVMEYVNGITLKEYIERKGKISFKEAVSIAIQVAKGIDAAHQHNIIHRDIKPQNIMISNEGKVKVTDFGIAKAATAQTVTSNVMGSVHYISPEQARNGYADFRSDIYSLGIVMYEMVTGRVPFDADTAVAVAVKHLQEDMVPAVVYATDLPVSMQGIIEKCTQKNADRRYQSMEELLADLKHALISPDEDFVVIPGAQGGTTMVYGKTQDEDDEDDDDEDDEDDDEDGFLNPRMEKAVKILSIVAGIVILIIVIVLLGKVFGWFGSSSTTESGDAVSELIEVPDLTGYTYDEAKELLNGMELGISISAYEESDEYEENLIISSDPEAGESVEANTTIYVVVSSGEGEFEMPDVTGYEEDEAIELIEAAGMTCSVEYEYSDTVDQGVVIEQSPNAGTDVTADTKVTLTVSRGKETVTVPSVTGLTQSSAESSLKSAGLTVGTVTSEYSSSVAEGYVISQSVSSGRKVESGTSVDLVVSLGEKVTYVTVPNVVGSSLSSAKSTLSNYGLTAVEGTTEYSDTYAAGIVISQSPASGSSVEEGTKVTLTISAGSDPDSYDTDEE